MKKREHRATSKAAHDSVKEHKGEMYEKITKGLQSLKVGGTFEEISKAAGMKPEQVWKRLSEMKMFGFVYPVGITRSLSSGRKGMVWQLIELKSNTNTGTTPVINPPSKKKVVLPVNQQPLKF